MTSAELELSVRTLCRSRSRDGDEVPGEVSGF